MAFQPPLALLLKNGGQERNMCFLNSIVQILRHVPEFVAELQTQASASPVLNCLYALYSNCGTDEEISALPLRRQIATATGTDINSGQQQDAIEVLGYILNLGSTNLFQFEYVTQYRFWINNQASPFPQDRSFNIPIEPTSDAP